MWPVLGSGVEAAVSPGCQPGGCCWCDFGFGCGRLETADAYRGAAVVQVFGVVGRRLPGHQFPGKMLRCHFSSSGCDSSVAGACRGATAM